jgi:trichothecene 3-O-acetyltransferase
MDWSQYQDVAGQLPSLQSYTQFCLLFPDRQSSRDLTLRKLENTSVRLASIFPWLSGQVVNEGCGVGSSGIFKIVPYRSPGTGFDICVKEDASLDYRDMAERKMPMAVLDGNRLSPKHDLTRMYNLATAPAPVLVLQVTFLRGGVAMTFAAAHNAMDMSGLGKLIDLFARILRAEEVTADEIEWGNKDRRELFALLRPSEEVLDHGMLAIDPEDKRKRDTGIPPARARWEYARFKNAKLAQLKDLASSQESSDRVGNQDSPSKISTDDALSAFIWQRIMLSRYPCVLPSPRTAETTVMCRAINGRRFLNPSIPASYMGQMVCCTFHSISLSAVTMEHLSNVARELRCKLNQQNDHSIRSFFSFVQKKEDKRLISFTARMNLSRDLLISSGAGLEVYHVDFGPTFGMPEWVRRPRWDSAEGVIYLMPKTREGDIDAAICLSEQDWDRMHRDMVWNEFAEYIG